MMLNASSWPCMDRAAPQLRNLKALLYMRPISRSLVQRRFSLVPSLAARAKKQLPSKAVPYGSRINEYETAAKKLARNPTPTLLYQAESNVPYILGCYFVGGILLGCAAINNATKKASFKADVAFWVPLGVAVGQFTMLGFGSWWCLKPQNVVKSIRSMPSRQPGARSVLLQIERTRSIPFVKPRTYTVPCRDITISSPLFLGGEKQVQAEIRELQRQERRYLYLNKEISPRTYPFRVLGYWTTLFFNGIRKAFTNRGLINFHIKGNNLSWKMETEAAWALEEGRALDGIVKIKEV